MAFFCIFASENRKTMHATDLKVFELFCDLSTDEIERFVRESVVYTRSYAIGNIFLQGMPCEALYLLSEGSVKATMANNDGKVVTIETLTAPRILAPSALYATENYFPVNIEVITPCQIIFVNKNSFYDLMHRESSVMEAYIKMLSDKCLFLSHKVNGFALQSLKGRLAEHLLSHNGKETQQEIADTLSVARTSLARVLADFINSGLIRMEGRHIVVIDRAGLRKMMG